MPPQVIAGRYEVLRSIGSGGMGTVWLCRDTVLGREVAVKQIGALPGDPAAQARAMREARIAASLNHPNAVGVFDVVDQDDTHWLVMEYVQGQSLAEQIRDEGALPATTVAGIGASVAGALARAHERGIVHRDIKPGNILMDGSGTPKISDFGIARAHADDQLTQTGFMTGTPGYLSPELARGGDPTAASDVWALGATLYYAVEGQPPYEPNANPLATLQAIANGEARPMEHAGPLAGAISAMMEHDPERRWDMSTASERLRRVADGDTTLALPAGAIPGAAAGVAAGAAATELLPEPVEGTQRMDQAPVASYAPEPTPFPGGPVPPAGPRDPGDDRDGRGGNKGLLWLVGILAAVALLLGVLYAVTDGFGSNTPQTPTTTTVTAPPKTETPSSSTTSSSSSSSSSSTTSTTTTPSTTTTTTTQPSPQDDAALADFVKTYYADVTSADKRDQTWAELTPGFQQQMGGRDSYEGFWSTIEKVDVGKTKADAKAGEVRVELTFQPKDGKKTKENHVLTVVRKGDSWLIDSDSQV